MFIVYILANPKGKRYIGSSHNLRERLKVHNDISREKARFHRTTYRKGPWEVIFSREFETREKALKFERYLKSGKGRERLKRQLERARRGG